MSGPRAYPRRNPVNATARAISTGASSRGGVTTMTFACLKRGMGDGKPALMMKRANPHSSPSRLKFDWWCSDRSCDEALGVLVVWDCHKEVLRAVGIAFELDFGADAAGRRVLRPCGPARPDRPRGFPATSRNMEIDSSTGLARLASMDFVFPRRSGGLQERYCLTAHAQLRHAPRSAAVAPRVERRGFSRSPLFWNPRRISSANRAWASSFG
jgi:hypothetical protein